MIKKIFILSVLSLVLSACQSSGNKQVVTQTEYIATDLPRSLDNCPVMRKFPAPETLKDGQVAGVLITLNTNNRKCRNSIDAIYSYHDKVKREIETKTKRAP